MGGIRQRGGGGRGRKGGEESQGPGGGDLFVDVVPARFRGLKTEGGRLSEEEMEAAKRKFIEVRDALLKAYGSLKEAEKEVTPEYLKKLGKEHGVTVSLDRWHETGNVILSVKPAPKKPSE